jgi:hypothetical protein
MKIARITEAMLLMSLSGRLDSLAYRLTRAAALVQTSLRLNDFSRQGSGNYGSGQAAFILACLA